MDIKKALAKGLQNQLLSGAIPMDHSERNVDFEWQGVMEATAVSPLETQIRVRTPGSVRYFTVKLTEHI